MATKTHVDTQKSEKEVTTVAVKEQVKKDSKAEKIRQLYLQGLNYYQIAKQLGLRAQYARNVIIQAVEAPSGYREIKEEYKRRLAAKQSKAEA